MRRWVLTIHAVDDSVLHRETFWTRRGAAKAGRVLSSPPLNYCRVTRR